MISVKRSLKLSVLFAGLLALGNVLNAESLAARQIPAGEKIKITGTIASRNGDLITIKDKKNGDLVNVAIFQDTKIERRKGKFLFVRHPRMDVTAMVPGLTIEAEGAGNANGQLEAKEILFSPDEFATAIAEAQYSADGASQAATDLGMLDAESVRVVNSRVSELVEYRILGEATIYCGDSQVSLDDAAKGELSRIARIASSTDNYLIEIACYASKTWSKELNQKWTEERASAVADYLRENGNVPMRRILAPACYEELDRRVEVRVLVNEGLGPAL